jgi:hypothetical protein
MEGHGHGEAWRVMVGDAAYVVFDGGLALVLCGDV